MSLLLSACVPPPTDGTARAPAALRTIAEGRVSLPELAAAGAEIKTDTPPGARLIPASLARPAEPPPDGGFALDRLIGLTGDALEAALGRPALLRRDGAAELWRYAGPGCALQVYLYKEESAFRVRYAEVRHFDGARPGLPSCIPWKARRAPAGDAAAETAAAQDPPPIAATP